MDGKRLLDLSKDEDFHPEPEPLEGDLDPGLPSTEDVILKTEQVTKNIQELLRAAQEFKHDRSGWIPPSAPSWFQVPCRKRRAEEKGASLLCRIGSTGGVGVWKGARKESRGGCRPLWLVAEKGAVIPKPHGARELSVCHKLLQCILLFWPWLPLASCH